MTLTRERIMSMTTEELDVAIAEQIFGLRIDTRRASTKVVWNDKGEWEFIEPYSTDMRAAWGVVEKMRAEGIYLDVRVWPDRYQVLPHEDENNKLLDKFIVSATSLPEAICRAALLTLTKEG